MKKAYSDSKTTGLPFSEAVEVNGTVYVAGQVHIDNNGSLTGETMPEKVRVTMGNVERILKEAELTLNDVVKVEIYLPNLERDADEVRETYLEFWQHPMPARAMIGVASLPLGADIEIVVTAARS